MLHYDDLIREILAATVMAKPCTFPSGGFTKDRNRNINDYCAPEDIRPEVVLAVRKAIGRKPS